MTRRLLGTIAAIAVTVLFVGVVASTLQQTTRNLALPLSDASIIRRQAAEKRLDPALIAAVIYAETKFEPRPSSAGAEGLMQILPSTAYYLARLSGGSSFTASDLSEPSVNVAYGSYYLRYLLDHYGGNEMLAVAAYNGGETNVDRWVAQADAAGRQLSVQEIPFSETREYVQRVLGAQRAYRATYPRQLGIA
ncbi:MAG TPA: lytic transglycosylase domain-containing protein [Solirubrobacteraceae bacterium]|jgi:soluble lytic murein transglycosylase|nr:lytic transglycosylase domain-containing protein [Solirubrobacteraceae bacterium]